MPEVNDKVTRWQDDRVAASPGHPVTWSSLHRVTLSVILVAYLIIGALYATRTPAWQVPDEPAHYNYIRHLVEQRSFPVLELGDYDQAYLSGLTRDKFPPDRPIDRLEYEDHQPPVYYLLAAPLFAASTGNLIALRLLSLALGGGVVIFTFLLARQVFPDRPVLALTAAGFVAFLPQHIAMMAGVNNDSLAELVMVVGLWLSLKYLGSPTAGLRHWSLSLVVGLAFITKTTVYPLAASVGGMLLLKARRDGWSGRYLVGVGARIFLPALLLGGLWWGRNLAVYGDADVLGLQRHNAVVVGQPRTLDWIAELGWAEYTRRFVVTTFQSFWGQFGWMGVVMDRRVYLALLAYSLFIAAGLAGTGLRQWRSPSVSPSGRDAAVLLAATLLLVMAAYLYYNLTFVQFQGRYLYPALAVIGLGAAVGIGQWVRWAGAATRLNALGSNLWTEFALSLAPIALMAALDVFALYRFILPALT